MAVALAHCLGNPLYRPFGEGRLWLSGERVSECLQPWGRRRACLGTSSFWISADQVGIRNMPDCLSASSLPSPCNTRYFGHWFAVSWLLAGLFGLVMRDCLPSIWLVVLGYNYPSDCFSSPEEIHIAFVAYACLDSTYSRCSDMACTCWNEHSSMTEG